MRSATDPSTSRSRALGAIVPLSAVLFGLAEFASEWTWRPYVQGALAIVASAVSRRLPDEPRVRWPSFVLGPVLVVAAWKTQSFSWTLLAAVLLSSAGSRAGAFFVSAAAATIGAVCAHLRGPVLWIGDWGAASEILRLFPASLFSVNGDYLVVQGARIHRSAFSVLTALPAIGAVLAWHGMRGARLFLIGLLALSLAVATRIGFVLALVATLQPLWALHPLATGFFVSVAGLTTAYLASGLNHSEEDQERRWTWTAASLAGLALWVWLGPERSPAPRNLRVLIDDAHGEWETTGRPFGTKRYGRDTVYTYTLLREWLSRRHQVEVESAPPLRPRGEVLIVKTPALPYTEDEKASIRRFVQAGGGLLAIGDHTNLFGTTDHLNALLEESGLALRRDAAIPFIGVTRTFQPAWWNSGPLVPRGVAWELQTSATVESTRLRSHPLLVDTRVLAESAEYSNERNFGDLGPSPDDRRPPLVIAASVSRGAGRVVLLADSTPWSNFSFFAPPNKTVLDAALRLAATPTREGRRTLGAAVLALALVGGIVLGGARLHVLGGALGIFALLLALTTSDEGFAPTPTREGDRHAKLIIVDTATGPVNWSTDIRTGRPEERDVFSTFLAWISRFGAEPELRSEDAYSDATRPVLVLNPSRTVSAAAAAAAEEYVREGGRLLVLDDPVQRPGSTAPALLNPFRIRYHIEVTERTIHAEEGPQLPRLVWALPLTLLQDTRRRLGALLAERTGLEVSLEGVDPIWVDEHGLVVYGKKAIGKGRIQVFIRSSAFSQWVMGDVWGGVEPGREKEQSYELEYALLRDLFASGEREKRLDREFDLQ